MTLLEYQAPQYGTNGVLIALYNARGEEDANYIQCGK